MEMTSAPVTTYEQNNTFQQYVAHLHHPLTFEVQLIKARVCNTRS
jgi:hypothetical protein